MAWLLVDENTGTVIHKGDVRLDFRGDAHEIVGWSAPRHSGSTGRVIVKDKAFGTREYYPGVVYAKLVEVEEQ